MVSMTTTADMKCTTPMMTKDQKSRRVHSSTPDTNIHSSWNMGMMRTARASRPRRSTRKAARRRKMSISMPRGSKIQTTSTPVIQTTKVSNIFMGSNIHTQVSARKRKKYSVTKITTKTFSATVMSEGLTSPGLYMASMPEMMPFTTIKAPMKASKRRDSTIRFSDGCGGLSATAIFRTASCMRNQRIPVALCSLKTKVQSSSESSAG
mmetsp:Transcript_93060/g.221281  ORF Transcript_93060/g.221281 Transcript_93060/m.221281 type:complete len:208 (-) Transcript_93060:942-1565(-)